MISLPLLSWAVTILRTGGSVVWNCDMVIWTRVKSLGVGQGKVGETNPTYLYALRGGTRGPTPRTNA